jgi:predicted ribosome quality control (RQC) complex YloA/Tae2 family protein
MNGIYLFLLLREIKHDLTGLFIEDILSMDRLIQIILSKKSLFISLYPEAPAIFYTRTNKNNFQQLPHFSSDIRASRIAKIEQADFMPVVTLQLEKMGISKRESLELIISLYRQAPNIVIKTPSMQKKLYKRYIQKKPKIPITSLTERQLQSLQSEQLIKEIEGTDKYLTSELTAEHLRKLKSFVDGERINPRLISISPLRISLFASEYIKEYTSFNDLIKEGIEQYIKVKSESLTQTKKKAQIKNLKRCIARLEKKVLTDEEVELFRISGELILANIAKIKRSDKQAKVLNVYTQKNINIALDPQKTPQQNAQVYFSKYKKQKRGQPKIRQKITDIRKQIEDAMTKPLKQYEPLPHAKSVSPKEKPLPFRLFHLPSGSVVYVGKSAQSNAELTFQYARPNDYFFHVRGYGGAHTILKARVPKGQKPRREDIESAASIAAYFSKAKKQKKVTVSYTQRKYLKKNKKGKPGSVILMREEVIFVEPQLPQK